MKLILFFYFTFYLTFATGAVNAHQNLSEKLKLIARKSFNNAPARNTLIFDLPVTYNSHVSKWIAYYQGSGNTWFREWLERSYKFLPLIQSELKRYGLPNDLAYISMIESGFSSHAKSSSDAVGPWQFIKPTGLRYGLQINWWLDERKDLKKSTQAAIRYMRDLYNEFGSWYLVAASYNMGENGLRRRIQKYKTKDYWKLIQLNALPEETQNYVPKILAAMLIAKAPSLYGFRGLEKFNPISYEVHMVNGGTDLNILADRIGVTRKSLRDLNAELLLGYVPNQIDQHPIRLPHGASKFLGHNRHIDLQRRLANTNNKNNVAVE